MKVIRELIARTFAVSFWILGVYKNLKWKQLFSRMALWEREVRSTTHKPSPALNVNAVNAPIPPIFKIPSMFTSRGGGGGLKVRHIRILWT